ncbi:MAG: hypothetical protein WA080_05490 [Sulfuricurvum sp.]
MILKWLSIFIFLAMGNILLALAGWFDTKQVETEQIIQKERDAIRELRTIKETNTWLYESVIPYFSTLPLPQKQAELGMIDFYDRYAHVYHFQVSQFIYYDTSAKMDIGFSFVPKNQGEIDRFLALTYDQGFLQIQRIASSKGEMSGILTLIQPLSGDHNASGY